MIGKFERVPTFANCQSVSVANCCRNLYVKGANAAWTREVGATVCHKGHGPRNERLVVCSLAVHSHSSSVLQASHLHHQSLGVRPCPHNFTSSPLCYIISSTHHHCLYRPHCTHQALTALLSSSHTFIFTPRSFCGSHQAHIPPAAGPDASQSPNPRQRPFNMAPPIKSKSFVTLLCFLLSLLPLVMGTCSVMTITETTWVTVPNLSQATSSNADPQSTAFSEPAPTTTSLNTSPGDPIPTTTADNPTSLKPSAVPSASATYNPLPEPDAAIFSAPEPFNRLIPIPNSGSIRNSCKYDVYVWSVGCGNTADNVKIASGTTWTEPLRKCPNGGVVYKVSKNAGNSTSVMQFEAGVWADRDMVQYDLSYLNCMIPGTTDLSACAGWEGGHQAVAGNGCQVFVCKPGEYCDGSSYTVAEFGYQMGGVTHPNAGCAASQGVAFELCACSKA